HQKARMREDVHSDAKDLLNFKIPGGTITEAGLRSNINVGIQYIEAWLRGNGAVALYNLMEDAATAEISRAQVWQWTHHPEAVLADGRPVTLDLYKQLSAEEIEKIRTAMGAEAYAAGKFPLACELFDALVTQPTFTEFLTVGAYERLE